MALKSQPSEMHLSETQIDDFIIGDLEPQAAAHLATCSLCTERLASASSSLSSFQTLTTTWSERLSASLPAPLPTPQRPLWQRHLVLAAPCLVLIVGLNAIHTTYLNNAATQTLRTAQAHYGTSVVSQHSGVSADDKMLNAIESDLNPDFDSPADLGLRPVSASISSSGPSSVRD